MTWNDFPELIALACGLVQSEVINIQNLDANVAERTPRQIFAKVPGMFVYDIDGTGNQVNISTCGLDPHLFGLAWKKGLVLLIENGVAVMAASFLLSGKRTIAGLLYQIKNSNSFFEILQSEF